MYNYCFNYRDERGNFHVGYITAPDPQSAYRQAKAIYGDRMISEGVGIANNR